ncbi:hypothetical protein INS49_014808 [Diaporthe citri]|uniref:uncharacterized protein n=1 Tax=Diaporthe citri TaxID=83186 RepID=UPI001C7FCA7B|nr:uncharacterized protein INS49_014808 [Diaporthe citri]KAG6356933.1 hypothetical protein INS49_014808 [Diaporthe citri]
MPLGTALKVTALGTFVYVVARKATHNPSFNGTNGNNNHNPPLAPGRGSQPRSPTCTCGKDREDPHSTVR